ncbi:MAG: cupin domain-containing protein [Halioglobus sp.]|nr:cupin domain-containing protein [Halioglobus sp.]
MSHPASSMKACIKEYDQQQEYFFAEGCFITELSNSSDDPEVSIARARLEPGKTTRWHHLRGTTERYVVQQGEGSVEVGDLAPRRVVAGDVVIIPAEVRQRISNVGAGDLVFLAICSPRFTTEVYVDLEE